MAICYDLAAVQAALEDARVSLEDLDLAYSLQQHEFFGESNEPSSPEGSLGGSLGGDSVEALKAALEMQVQQLTEQLQQLKDAELARKLQSKQLDCAAQQALDRQLARVLSEREEEGCACDAESVAGSLQETVALEEQQGPAVTLSLAAAVAPSGGWASCGALVTTPDGDTLWKGAATIPTARFQQAQLEAALLGLEGAAQLGLPASWMLMVKCGAWLAEQLVDTSEAHSSLIGGLVAAAQGRLDNFAHWTVQAVDEIDLVDAAELVQRALQKHREATTVQAPALPALSPQLPSGVQRGTLDVEEVSRCSICFEELPGSCFHVIGGCLHRFCQGCLRGHLQTVIKGRTYPVLCPEPGCSNPMASEECELLLAASPSDVAMYRQVEAEGSIPSDLRFYCPNPHCSAPIQLDKSKGQPNDPLNCAACSTKICVFCRVEWHKGFTCEEYQALPTTLKKHEDVLFLDVARGQRWRQCGRCGHMIELREGCRHMTCNCGFEFCYTCGKPWERLPGGQSRQTCTCAIFDVPADTEPLAHPLAEGFDFNPAELRFVARQLAGFQHEDERRYLERDVWRRHPVPDDIPAWVPDERVPVWKTALCQFYLKGGCRRRHCYYAHDEDELRRYGHYGSRPQE